MIKEFPVLYGTRRFITLIHKGPPLVPILSQLNPVHTITRLLYLKIHFNIIVPSMSGSRKWFLSIRSH